MKLIRITALATVSYGDETDYTVLELTYNWGVDDISATCEKIRSCNGKVVRAGLRKHGSTVIPFAEDPGNYEVELIGLLKVLHRKSNY